jgi:phosphoenolpyruvate synthase/pyruvate phosphate dikinase
MHEVRYLFEETPPKLEKSLSEIIDELRVSLTPEQLSAFEQIVMELERTKFELTQYKHLIADLKSRLSRQQY